MLNMNPSEKRASAWKALVRGFIGLNVVLALAVGLFLLASVGPVAAAPSAQEAAPATGGLNGTVALAAALATGLATIGAGLAVGMAGSAALGTIAERPEAFGRALIFVGLAEGIAIYGLIVSFLILTS
ncbi:MAG: ATPase [Chloroflexi bacterium]|nr:ATPase [Chloroflexota bacterium]